MPVWAVVAISAGTTLLSFLGVLLGQRIERRSGRELEVRSRREETLRTLRWAAELAVSNDSARAGLGIAQLGALGAPEMLDDDQRLFVDAALEAIYADVNTVVARSGPGSVALGEVPADQADHQSSALGSEGEAEE